MAPRLPHMLKDAGVTAFIAAALGFFIVGFRTYDASGKGLVFDYQFGDLAIAIVTIFVGRIGLSLAADGLRWPALVLGAVLGGIGASPVALPSQACCFSCTTASSTSSSDFWRASRLSRRRFWAASARCLERCWEDC